MSGNGITFSEYNAGAALPKIVPTATGAGPVEMGMKGGKRKGRFSKKMKGCGKKGGKSRRRRTSRR